MKNKYFSNCYIEAKKAEKKGCKIIKLGFLYTGKLIPHFFWYDSKEDAYFDFNKDCQSSNDLFYKGYVRKTSKTDFIRHINRFITRTTSVISEKTGIPIAQNNLDGGMNLFFRDWWFESSQCFSGKILYIENVKGKEIYKVENADDLEPTKDGDYIVLKKLADNKNVIGWMYWNVY